MESIRVSDLGKSYGPVRALDRVTLEIAAGELFFLLGPSGCGKSTLLRGIAGLEMPDSGRVWFGDTDVTSLPPHRRGTAMVFQSYALWPHLTVARNISFGLEERRVPAAEIRKRVDEALEMVRLPGYGPRAIDQMSGGQQQRVALARALVVRPRCLLLDEPLSNLDTRLRLEMRREIRRIVKDHGLTAIYVTHDQEEALAMADRIAVMDRGRLAQTGTPADIYRTPRSAMVAGFIGETNIISGTVEDADGRAVRTAAGLLRVTLPDPAWHPAMGEAVAVSIRPEAWRTQGAEGDNHMSGTVLERVYLGARVEYRVETAAGVLQVTQTHQSQWLEPGARVDLHCGAEDAVAVVPGE